MMIIPEATFQLLTPLGEHGLGLLLSGSEVLVAFGGVSFCF